MSKYLELKNNPPKLQVVTDAREVVFNTVSCMCGNKGKLTFKKSSDGDFKLSGNGFAISNWQMKFDEQELEWTADEQEWTKLATMINTGTAVIESVVSR